MALRELVQVQVVQAVRGLMEMMELVLLLAQRVWLDLVLPLAPLELVLLRERREPDFLQTAITLMLVPIFITTITIQVVTPPLGTQEIMESGTQATMVLRGTMETLGLMALKVWRVMLAMLGILALMGSEE